MRTVSEFKVENYLDADADALIASRKLLHANVCWCCLAEGIMFDEQHKEKQLFTNCSMKNPHFEFHEISNHFSVSTLLAVGYSSNTVASSTVGSPDGGISKESNETSKECADLQDISTIFAGKSFAVGMYWADATHLTGRRRWMLRSQQNRQIPRNTQRLGLARSTAV